MNLITARKLLGVGVMASADDVTKAYRKKVYAVHPDRNPNDPRAGEKVVRLTEAYGLVKRASAVPPQARGVAWKWFHVDDATAAGDPSYKAGTDPLTDLINEMRRTVREMDPDKVAYGAAAAAIGILIFSEMLRKK